MTVDHFRYVSGCKASAKWTPCDPRKSCSVCGELRTERGVIQCSTSRSVLGVTVQCFHQGNWRWWWWQQCGQQDGRFGLKGVDFIVSNTDARPLRHSATVQLQIGALTNGLGAGANPDVVGAALGTSMSLVIQCLVQTWFITAGMGGGTGTGAAPVFAGAAREAGALTVGVVTKPFNFEGRSRERAEAGIEALAAAVDTLIVISNQRLPQSVTRARR